MVDSLNTFAERIKFLRKARGLSLAALGSKLGVSAQAVHKWEQGGQIESWRKVEIGRALDASIDWLFFGRGSPEDKHSIDVEIPDWPAVPQERSDACVPIMTNEFMLQWLIGNGSAKYKGEWIPCPAVHGPRTYALRISDTSMVSNSGPISYSIGDIVFVDPDRKYDKDTRVVLFDPSSNNDFLAIVRELFSKDGRLHIRALNHDWQDSERELRDEDRLSGTVIGMWRPE